LTSRGPQKLHDALANDPKLSANLLPPVRADITNPDLLDSAFREASVVVSLVGIMHGTPDKFERVQWHGAKNVARAAKEAGAKLVHISAIGADANSHIPYARTKALGEQAVFEECPNATIIRPSLVFGPGDEFFAVSCLVQLYNTSWGSDTCHSALLNWQHTCPSCLLSEAARPSSSLSMRATWPAQ
jgi:uncharacterized protein YbjT (DUF2867 family)